MSKTKSTNTATTLSTVKTTTLPGDVIIKGQVPTMQNPPPPPPKKK